MYPLTAIDGSASPPVCVPHLRGRGIGRPVDCASREKQASMAEQTIEAPRRANASEKAPTPTKDML